MNDQLEQGFSGDRQIDSSFPLSPLKPENFTDEENKARTIYTFKTKSDRAVKALFYSLGDLPFFSKIMEGSKIFILGQRPKQRMEKEWEDYIQRVKSASPDSLYPLNPLPQTVNAAIEQEKALFLVDSSLINVLDLAFILGVDDPRLRQIRAKAHQQELGPEANQLIDQIIAGKIVDDIGNLRIEHNCQGEAMMVSTLLGDQTAQAVLEKKLEILRQHDRVKDEMRVGLFKQEEDSMRKELLEEANKSAEASDSLHLPEFQLSDLVIIRITANLPQKRGGEMFLQSPFDGTGGRLPRNTLHFTLNHIVGEHAYGSWTGVPYTIVAPLDKVVEMNGLPRSINAADTYFDISPGSTLRLPKETVIVKPEGLPEGILFKDKSQGVVYKSRIFTPKDIEELIRLIGSESKLYPYWINEYITTSLHGEMEEMIRHFWSKIYLGEEKGDQIDAFQEKVSQDLDSVNTTIGYPGLELDWLEVLKDTPLPEVTSNLVAKFKELGLSAKLPEDVAFFMTNVIERKLSTEVQELAIRQKLNDMGYKWMTSGGWGNIYDRADDLKLKLLSIKLGVLPMPHSGDKLSELEGFINAKVLAGGESELFIDLERRDEILGKYLGQVPQSARRMLYAMGAL